MENVNAMLSLGNVIPLQTSYQPRAHGHGHDAYLFGDFVLIPALFELRRGPCVVSVAPKVFDLILHLVENHDRVLTHEDLLAALWPAVTVTMGSLAYAVTEARRVLGDAGSKQLFIRNLRGRGYRFVAAVEHARV